MLNITYKGKFENEKQLICDDKLPQKAVRFDEGESIEDLFNFGFIIELPIIIPIMIITIFKLENTEGHINLNLRLVFIIAIAFLLKYLLKFVHEYIHAIFFPIKSKKQYGVQKMVLILYIVMLKFQKQDLLSCHLHLW